MSFKDDISEAKSKEFNYIHKANEDFADDIIESNTNCWSCGTDIPLGKKYCEYHCGHPADEFDSFTGQCTACGKSLNVNMMMAMPVAESKATEVKIERGNGSMTIDGKPVIKIWESFNGWYWYAVEDRGQYTGIDYDGNDVEVHAWFGYVQGDFNEWGTFDSKELERSGVWEVPRSNWAYTGRMEESKSTEAEDDWVDKYFEFENWIENGEFYGYLRTCKLCGMRHESGKIGEQRDHLINNHGFTLNELEGKIPTYESKASEDWFEDDGNVSSVLKWKLVYEDGSDYGFQTDNKAEAQRAVDQWNETNADRPIKIVSNAGEMNAKTLTDNWYNIGNGLAQCKHCTFKSGSWSEFAEHLEEAHGIGEDEDSDFVSFESSEDVIMYEPSNDPSGVAFWWDFESPMNDMKHEQISSLLGIDHNKAWAFLTKAEQDRVSDYKLNKVISSEKEELLSDVIAKINAKYSGDDEEDEEATEEVTFGHGWDAQDGWTDDMLLDRINRGNTDYNHLTDQELDAWRRSTGQATSDIGSTPIGGRGSKHNNYSIYNDPVLPYGESNATEDSPCWDGYEQIGMKEKDGKQVPNCVPKDGE